MIASKSVLYVDDESDARSAFARALRRTPYSLRTAGNADEALLAAWEIRFDLAVLDIAMPGTDGWHLLASLRQIDPGLPVIMLTGLQTDYALFHSVELGCDGFLEKPIGRADLVSQIESILIHRNRLHQKRPHRCRLTGWG